MSSAVQYFPPYGVIDSRNSHNRYRARTKYSVPDACLTADSMVLEQKFRGRCTPDGNLRCYLCGRPVVDDNDWHLDHVHPLALGGTHIDDNLEPACPSCNLNKRDLTLEEFIGPEEAKRWRALGWPPPFEDLAKKPVDELWKMSARVAKRFARSPREVDPREAPWGTNEGRDRDIARYLVAQPDPWRAVAVKDLAEPLGYEVATSLKQQWEVAMGMGGYPSRPFEYGVRNDSPLILPTRTPPQPRKLVGEPAFRLRFEVDAGALRVLGDRDLRQFARLRTSDAATATLATPSVGRASAQRPQPDSGRAGRP